jgi:hypothetical protein
VLSSGTIRIRRSQFARNALNHQRLPGQTDSTRPGAQIPRARLGPPPTDGISPNQPVSPESGEGSSCYPEPHDVRKAHMVKLLVDVTILIGAQLTGVAAVAAVDVKRVPAGWGSPCTGRAMIRIISVASYRSADQNRLQRTTCCVPERDPMGEAPTSSPGIEHCNKPVGDFKSRLRPVQSLSRLNASAVAMRDLLARSDKRSNTVLTLPFVSLEPLS